MDHDSADPALADIEREWPRLAHVAAGCAGLLFASRRMTRPPAVLRDENTTELRAQIKSWEETHF